MVSGASLAKSLNGPPKISIYVVSTTLSIPFVTLRSYEMIIMNHGSNNIYLCSFISDGIWFT